MKLVHGSGSPETGACWMSALNWYAHPEKAWGDTPQCVDPIIRSLCIHINDTTPVNEMEDFIGPHLFAPLGTRGDAEWMQKRVVRLMDFGIRQLAPFLLDLCDEPRMVSLLKSFPPIRDQVDLDIVRYALRNVPPQLFPNFPPAVSIMTSIENALAIRGTILDPSFVFHIAQITVVPHPKRTIREMFLDLVLELCKMGREEVKTTRTKEETIEALNEGCFVEK